MQSVDMILGGILKTKPKIFREPGFVCIKPWHRGSAFTMRLLNFLFKLKMKAQRPILPHNVDYFAARHTYGETEETN